MIRNWDCYFRARRSDIDPALWHDTSVVIERYIENHEQSFYRVYCFGESIVVVKAHSSKLIKKIDEHLEDRNTYLTRDQIMGKTCDIPMPLQKTIRRFIRSYPIDYFCLDIVHDTSHFFIIDLNLTPYSGLGPQNSQATDFLIEGGRQLAKSSHGTRLATA